MTKEETEIWRHVTSKQTESVIKDLPTKESATPDGFTGEVYQILKEELIANLIKLFQKSEEEGILVNSFCEGSIIILPKPEKHMMRKENHKRHP